MLQIKKMKKISLILGLSLISCVVQAEVTRNSSTIGGTRAKVMNGSVNLQEQIETYSVVTLEEDDEGNISSRTITVRKNKNNIAACDSQCAQADVDSSIVNISSELEPNPSLIP